MVDTILIPFVQLSLVMFTLILMIRGQRFILRKYLHRKSTNLLVLALGLGVYYGLVFSVILGIIGFRYPVDRLLYPFLDAMIFGLGLGFYSVFIMPRYARYLIKARKEITAEAEINDVDKTT